eukprot:2382183-Amphidinium_carterae.3
MATYLCIAATVGPRSPWLCIASNGTGTTIALTLRNPECPNTPRTPKQFKVGFPQIAQVGQKSLDSLELILRKHATPLSPLRIMESATYDCGSVKKAATKVTQTSSEGAAGGRL